MANEIQKVGGGSMATTAGATMPVQAQKLKRGWWATVLVVLVLVLIVLGFMVRSCSNRSDSSVVTNPVGINQGNSNPGGGVIQTQNPPRPAMHEVYTVKRGDFLRKIAQEHGVEWEAMLLVNEEYLKAKYEEVCVNGQVRLKHSLFCNDKYKRPYGNTLSPGWEIKIPANSAPQNVNQAVAQIQGKRVALVIDDSGSIGNDRKMVSEWYLAAFKTHGKEIIGVWLYSDGHIRHYTQAAEVVLRAAGSYENTYSALRAAAQEKPDSIVLVTDEPGDDWGNWSGVESLPPVVAHCLPDPLHMSCEANLKRLAAATHGQYMMGLQ